MRLCRMSRWQAFSDTYHVVTRPYLLQFDVCCGKALLNAVGPRGLLRKLAVMAPQPAIGSITVENRVFHLVENFVDLAPGSVEICITAALLSVAFCCSLLVFFSFLLVFLPFCCRLQLGHELLETNITRHLL